MGQQIGDCELVRLGQGVQRSRTLPGLASCSLDDIQRINSPHDPVPSDFGTITVIDDVTAKGPLSPSQRLSTPPDYSTGRTTSGGSDTRPSDAQTEPAGRDTRSRDPRPAAPDRTRVGETGDAPTDTSGIQNAWKALNDAQTPEEKEKALQRFKELVAASDATYKTADKAAEQAADQATSKFPGVGPHDFSQARAEQSRALLNIQDRFAELTGDDHKEIDAKFRRWLEDDKTDSHEREKIEAEIREKHPQLADAMQDLRHVQERYASLYAHGEEASARLSHTDIARTDRAAFQARLDTRQALSFALRSLGRDREADQVDEERHDIEHTQRPLF